MHGRQVQGVAMIVLNYRRDERAQVPASPDRHHGPSGELPAQSDYAGIIGEWGLNEIGHILVRVSFG
jgi:hypothetical protein